MNLGSREREPMLPQEKLERERGLEPIVLVVDGEDGLRHDLRTLLESSGYRVANGNGSAAGAPQMNRNGQPQVVLVAGVNGDGHAEATPRSGVLVRLGCLCDVKDVVSAVQHGSLGQVAGWLPRAERLPNGAHRAECAAGAEAQAVFATRGGVALGPQNQTAEGETQPWIEEVAPDSFFVAASTTMRRLREEALHIAEADVPVLLLGESGTGKEILALLIHKSSARRQKPFLKVNCAALPSELLESELFGYEAGAFTGAVRAKPGKFELCNGGSILLDEIGEMPPFLQAKLLQVLQDGTFSRLGGKTTIRTDVRVLAATNVDVSKAIADGRLREDLYYRLNAFTFVMPPLRERPGEIPILLQHFLGRYTARYNRPAKPMSPTVVEQASAYAWPGNLRELENFVKRYVILGDEGALLQDLREKSMGALAKNPAHPIPGGNGLKGLVRSLKDEAEQKAIARALEQTNWNRKEAARLLAISYKALLYKIRQYGLDH